MLWLYIVAEESKKEIYNKICQDTFKVLLINILPYLITSLLKEFEKYFKFEIYKLIYLILIKTKFIILL